MVRPVVGKECGSVSVIKEMEKERANACEGGEEE